MAQDTSKENLKIVRSLPEDIWRNFVASQPNGNIFHTPEMFQVMKSTKGHQPQLWAAISGDTIAALYLPVQISLWDGILSFATTRSVLYGSVLCAPGPEGATALDRLLRTYKREVSKKSIFTEIRNLYNVSPLQPVLQSNGYAYEDHLNYRVALNLPPEEVWNNIHESGRKSIRRALRRNQVEIIEVTDEAQVVESYALLKKTYKQAHIPLNDFSLFDSAFKVLYPKGMIKFLLGRIDGEWVAASVALLYKDVIYGWYRGFDRNYSSESPNELMVWNILKWGAENDYAVFDFGGAGRPTETYGPRQFKAKFGGKLVNYGRNTYIHYPKAFRVIQRAYQMGRPFLSR